MHSSTPVSTRDCVCFNHSLQLLGAIRLALAVANEKDRGKRALSWLRDGMPAQDPRKAAFDARKQCYELIHHVIKSVDEAMSMTPEVVDGQISVFGRRRNEAYEVINSSDDEVFKNDLFDWYLSQGWNDRLLELHSKFVQEYLERKAKENLAHADLLWRYHAMHRNFYDAASVQLDLAKSSFSLDLRARIDYLSRAKANASTRLPGFSDVRSSRRSRQELAREASDLLDLADIQLSVIDRLRSDSRLEEKPRQEAVTKLDGQIQSVTTLFNEYADPGGYYEVCLFIYKAADYRVDADIRATWDRLIKQIHDRYVREGGDHTGESRMRASYALVAADIESIGRRLGGAEYVFPTRYLLPRLLLHHANVVVAEGLATPDNSWVLDIFTNLDIPYETILHILETCLYSDERPWAPEKNRKLVIKNIIMAAERWITSSASMAVGIEGEAALPLGGLENALGLSECLRGVVEESEQQTWLRGPPMAEWRERLADVREKVEYLIRELQRTGL
jgi:nuclear pore complex protein Nup155